MNNLKFLFLPFLFLSILLNGQKVDSVPIPYWLTQNATKTNSEVLKKGNRLFYRYNVDTLTGYLLLNRKFVISNRSIFYLEWNEGELIIEEKNSLKKIYTSPFIDYYDNFIENPKSWDVNKFFWGLNAIGLMPNGGEPFCIGVNGYLKKIPLEEIDSWTGNLSVKKVPRYGKHNITKFLPMDNLFYEKYYLEQVEKMKKQERFLTQIDVNNSVVKETFFDFLVTSKLEPRYVLYHDKKLLMWQLNEKTKQWEQQLSLPFNTNGFFTCFEFKNKLYLIDFEGVIYKITEKSIKKVKKISEKLINIALVIDKDAGTIGYIKQSDFNESSLMSKVINEKTINIFK